MARSIDFTKMEGAGNDYIYIDVSRIPVGNPAELSRHLSDRHFGVGADGLVLITPSDRADFGMRMFNADGSEGRMCGNAARCIGKYLYDKGLTRKLDLSLETVSGIKHLSLRPGPDGSIESVTVGMGRITAAPAELNIEAAGEHFTGTVVDVGNPHFVIFCENAESVDLERIGPAIECHPLFPGRTNVEFVSEDAHGRLRMRVWERGSGITLACGTGACAVAAAASAKSTAACAQHHAACAEHTAAFSEHTAESVTHSTTAEKEPCTFDIVCDGGTLRVQLAPDGELLLSGPARTVFEGTLEL